MSAWRHFLDLNLSNSAGSGSIFWCKVWLWLGADIHYFDDICLKKAVIHNDVAMVKFLMDRGAHGQTSMLYMSVLMRHRSMVILLMEHGFDIKHLKAELENLKLTRDDIRNIAKKRLQKQCL